MKLKFEKHMGGPHWVYTANTGQKLSIIIHDGSYGHESGLFEIMPSWCEPTPGNQVQGFLNFAEVHRWIKRLEKIEEKHNMRCRLRVHRQHEKQ